MPKNTNRPIVGPHGEVDDGVRDWATELARDESMRTLEPFTIENCQATKETPMALLVTNVDEEKEFWVPKSVIHDDSEVFEKGHKGRLVVEGWFARKEGWSDD